MSDISPESHINRQECSEIHGEIGALNPLENEPKENCALRNDKLLLNTFLQTEPVARRKKWRVWEAETDKLQKEDEQVGSEELLITCYRRVALTNMPAIKKERLDGEEMALAAFNQPMETLPEYLAPLNAAAIPVVTPHPPPYDQIFAQHRAYLGLHETHHRHHHHHHPEDLMLERFSSVPDFQPLFDNGEHCIEVECGENKALLYINKLCQGSKGPSIRYRGEWLTPNEFQFVSGRETAKDWKRSIRHKGKSLKTLMSKGILQVHPPICDCPGCRISSPVNRGRLAEKRTIPLPPTRIPKRELSSIFSSDESEESERANGDNTEIKQEDDIHISIMKRSRDSDLSTIISNLHQSRHFVMPESQSRSEIKRNRIDIGSGSADEILGKRRVYSPNSSSECPSENKKSRSVSPKEISHTPVHEELAFQMTPEEHYRRMMSALNEHGSYEEQQQRLYQLANSMGVPSHGDILRARQEAAVRNSNAMEAHLPSGTNSSSQRRKQGLPQHRDAHFSEREMSHPPPLLSPQNAPHIALGPHLRPPFLGMPSALCQAPGYGFLQPAQAEMFARQQEMLRKQNLARLEMSAELLRQKELENLHRQRLMADPLSLHPGIPPDHPALRNLHDIPEGHPLREEISRRNAMLVLRHNNTPLLSLNHQGVAGSTQPKEPSSRKGSRKGGNYRNELQSPPEAKDQLGDTRARDSVTDCNDEEMKDSESDAEVGDDKTEGLLKSDSGASEHKEGKETVKPCEGMKELKETSVGQNAPCGSTGAESPSHPFGPGINKNEVKYLPPGAAPPPLPLPFGFPYAASPYFHTGAMGGLFLDGEESSIVEDISKWTVDDVCNFVSGLSGCAEYTQVFREQAIDGETLPLLSEEHLLNNMGLKLGPVLKIRSQVAKRIGRVLYMTSFPLAFPLQPSALRPPERELPPPENRPSSTGSVSSPYSSLQASRISPKQENGNSSSAGISDTTKPPS
ncbi:sterile alpha motif domain-containing protein 11-like isoform X1 [Polyodon spathula]|uniref:sterile alpha motif domain-containing protein 11-like isoform X1 n=2 Tax=Polyodon spathula TaxID=7913 RepID=UPI001B7EB4B5|nr:sterile alpha motif domain-containing protein 11-like isoform X1 [Polyodon spathula]